MLAVIPWFTVPALKIGPLSLHAFGALAAAGILVGANLVVRAVRRIGPGDEAPLADAAPWAVVGGLIGAHLMHVFLYHPEMLHDEGFVAVLKVWSGLSSMGGVLGGLLGFFLYVHWRGKTLIPYLNALALGVAPGWAIARIGCSVAHDHPGIRTNVFFALAKWPGYPGGARLDMGMMDLVVLTLITGLLYFLARKPRPEGFLMGILAVTYCTIRFFLDFLRAHDLPVYIMDRRIAGLTPAQWTCLILVPTGIWLLIRAHGREPMKAPGDADKSGKSGKTGKSGKSKSKSGKAKGKAPSAQS